MSNNKCTSKAEIYILKKIYFSEPKVKIIFQKKRTFKPLRQTGARGSPKLLFFRILAHCEQWDFFFTDGAAFYEASIESVMKKLALSR